LRRGLKGGSCAKLLFSEAKAGATDIGAVGAVRLTEEVGAAAVKSGIGGLGGLAGGKGSDGSCAGTGFSSRTGASWKQLWRHDAQRTERPVGPMALSGTR